MTILVLGVSYTVMGFALSLSPLRSAPELRTASARSKQLQSG
jgi:hypothetical protein